MLCGLPARRSLTAKGTRTVRVHHIESRPHVQGTGSPLRLRHSSGELTDGGGLLLIRRMWDQLGIGVWLENRTRGIGGRFRPALMIEVWVILLLYGGGAMDDLRVLRARGIRRLFGWRAIPDPTTFGRWVRRAGERLAGVLDCLLWLLVQRRWQQPGTPSRIMVVLDSTVVVRYGRKQAGAEVGYNPRKPGRPGHHPLVAFAADTGDCLGVLWRPGSTHGQGLLLEGDGPGSHRHGRSLLPEGAAPLVGSQCGGKLAPLREGHGPVDGHGRAPGCAPAGV
jgi:hypothetical protein